MPPKTERFEMRLELELIERIDNWRRQQSDLPARAEAIRRLIELALAGAQPMKRRSPIATAKASDMAARQIDRLANPSLPEEEQQARKRRLIKGPKEFRDMRRDLPKAKS